MNHRLSQALVRYLYRQAVEVQNSLGGVSRYEIAGYETQYLDGNHLSGIEHRLKETRHITAALLPGKSLVAMGPRYNAISDYFPIEDGHAQQRTALDDVLATIRRDTLWVADGKFCTLKFMYGIVNSIHQRANTATSSVSVSNPESEKAPSREPQP